MENINRNKYLNELISLRHNGMIKVITGMRRCGKSYLLFEIFARYLIDSGVSPDHLIKIDLEDFGNMEMRVPKTFIISLKAQSVTRICTIFYLMKFRCLISLKMY